eukprot:1793479-Pyramimonas_sp.AAC.1
MHSAWPEFRRCGWSAVQMGEFGLPVRAAYGPLPGPIQSVGRAERYALLRGLQLLPRLVLSVSDLLGA